MKFHGLHSQVFKDFVMPLLDRLPAEELSERIQAKWSRSQVLGLLNDEDSQVRQLVCLVMGLIGKADDTQMLVAALNDNDEQVAQMAEYALWQIWFRSDVSEAQALFNKGLNLMEAEDYRNAQKHFHAATLADPGFAEAYNQCAISHLMLEEWDYALKDCHAACSVVPNHFGAIAGLGHCYLQTGCLQEAASYYKTALGVNPRMSDVRETLGKIEKHLESQ